jgi:hypothetical protein
VRRRSERGSGLVASLAGLLVVLVLLLFAVESLVGLYARSMLTAAAHDGARAVAVDDGVRGGERALAPEVVAPAEQQVRGLLGQAGDTAELTWSIEADQVVLRARTRRPSFRPDAWRPGDDPEWIERTVRVRIERLR